MSDLITPKLIAGTVPNNIKFCDIKTFDDLFRVLVAYVKPELGGSDTLKEVIFKADTPDETDRDKIWVKTSIPYAIGVFVSGEYRMFYQGTVGVWGLTNLNPLPPGYREATGAELALQPTIPVGSTFKWVIFEV